MLELGPELRSSDLNLVLLLIYPMIVYKIFLNFIILNFKITILLLIKINKRLMMKYGNKNTSQASD